MENPMPSEMITLIGDSIFDNLSYVENNGDPCVLQQLWRKIRYNALPWEVKFLAQDGATVEDVINGQIKLIPPTTTFLVVSVGGNNGLQFLDDHANQFWNPCMWLTLWREFSQKFNEVYSILAASIDDIQTAEMSVAVCTIYQPKWTIPGSKEIVLPVIYYMNYVIKSFAKTHGFHVIDVYAMFTDDSDYANPIEPSCKGGDKLTNNMIKMVDHVRMNGASHVYTAYTSYHELEYETPIPNEFSLLYDAMQYRNNWSIENSYDWKALWSIENAYDWKALKGE